MKLKPYHNPKNVDESKVPKGWRFRYANEMGARVPKSKFWSKYSEKWQKSACFGTDPMATYIVPVKA